MKKIFTISIFLLMCISFIPGADAVEFEYDLERDMVDFACEYNNELYQALLSEERSVDEYLDSNSSFFEKWTSDYYLVDGQYFIELTAGPDLATNIVKNNNEMTVEMFCYNPVIYIPVWSRVTGEPRIVGYIQYSYRAYKEAYDYSCAMTNVNDPTFISGEGLHFLEEVYNITNQYSSTEGINNYLLVQLAFAPNNDSNKILIMKDDNGQKHVYDISNTAHASEDNIHTYIFEDYIYLRSEYEKSISDNDPMVWAASGSGGFIGSLNRFWFWSSVIMFTCLVIFVVGLIILISHKKVVWVKKKKRQ